MQRVEDEQSIAESRLCSCAMCSHAPAQSPMYLDHFILQREPHFLSSYISLVAKSRPSLARSAPLVS